MIDPEKLTKILEEPGMAYQERNKLGLVNHPPIKYQVIISHLAELIDSRGYFPSTIATLSGEGSVVEKRGPSEYVFFSQRAYANRPVIAEQDETVFQTAMDAARHYAKWELGLPDQRICGIRVEE